MKPESSTKVTEGSLKMEYLYLGKIVNTHGIKGEVRLLSSFKYKEKVFVEGFPIYIGEDKKREIITSYRPHKQFDMITIKGITNINEVLKYKGKKVYIQREDLHLTKEEYLDEDLIGLNVIVNHEVVGVVKKLDRNGQDKIVVNKNGILYYVPYVCDIIKNINLTDGFIEIEYIKGLLD